MSSPRPLRACRPAGWRALGGLPVSAGYGSGTPRARFAARVPGQPGFTGPRLGAFFPDWFVPSRRGAWRCLFQPQVLEDGQRVAEPGVRGGVVFVLAVEQSAGVQQPRLTVRERHGASAAHAHPGRHGRGPGERQTPRAATQTLAQAANRAPAHARHRRLHHRRPRRVVHRVPADRVPHPPT